MRFGFFLLLFSRAAAAGSCFAFAQFLHLVAAPILARNPRIAPDWRSHAQKNTVSSASDGGSEQRRPRRKERGRRSFFFFFAFFSLFLCLPRRRSSTWRGRAKPRKANEEDEKRRPQSLRPFFPSAQLRKTRACHLGSGSTV